MSGTVLHTSLVMWLIWRAVISLKFQACLTYPSIHPLRSHLSWSWQLAFYRVDGWMSTSHLFHCVPPSNSVGCTAKVQCGALLKGTSVGQCEVFHFSGNILTQRTLLSSPLLLPGLCCVALPRLSHQAPTNLTCFSHFLHQRDGDRAQRRGGGEAARGMCTGS